MLAVGQGGVYQNNGVNIIAFNMSGGGRLRRMTRTVLKLYREAVRLDCHIYHIHDPEMIPVGLLLLLQGKQVIYDIHEDVPRSILNKKWIAPAIRKGIAAVFELFENWAVKRFSYIITATDHIARRFMGIQKNVVTVFNFPLLADFPDQFLNETVKKRMFVYVGAINQARGIFEMVQAMETMDAKLVIGGTFETDKLFAAAMGMPGWGKVSYLGMLNRSEVGQVLAQSVAGLVLLHPTPSYVHAMPIKLFEYMAAGIPVIVSDFPLWRVIVDQSKCGFCVDPADIAEIRRAMQWLLDHPAEAREMGMRGKHAVYALYNWETEKGKLINIYQQMAEN